VTDPETFLRAVTLRDLIVMEPEGIRGDVRRLQGCDLDVRRKGAGQKAGMATFAT